MRRWNLSHYAISSCVTAALLAGCGGAQPPIGAPGMTPLASRAEGRARHSPATSAYQVLLSFGHHAHVSKDLGGAYPWSNLIDVNGRLYGTTAAGGSDDQGTVFSISTSGEKKTLYRFGAGSSDGADPLAGLIEVNRTLYGTTYSGGSSGYGVVFSLSTAGAEKVLYSFKGGSDGAHPRASLVDRNGTLYGTTEQGGGSGCSSSFGSGCGTVYSITTSGQEMTLYQFAVGSNGAHPHAGLIAVKDTLYGTTRDGGAHDCGTVFKVTTSGSEKLLHSFNCYSDGGSVWAPLIDVKGTLYGTTEFGGAFGSGTVFSMSTNGREKVLHNFAGGSDGEVPLAGLVYFSGEFFGTTLGGGSLTCSTGSYSGCGVVYGVDASGSESVVHSFQGNSDGVESTAALVNVSGTLYGTTIWGGGPGCRGQGCGTVFALTP
jgi:uncharacterized repeat protein (TIGR03803 family)